mgnify:CR=1 FL=1
MLLEYRLESMQDDLKLTPAQSRLFDAYAERVRALGEDIAQRVGPIWGFDDQGELANMWKRTPQPGLWFVGSGFAGCRQYSRYVGLQIKAIELGLMPKAL